MTPSAEPSSPGDGTRKRVCKACDRCRLKKSKCDGATPCSRCKADNAICVFGERKKSHDKVYPKGYVEMLENQQAQLVAGLQELYRRLRADEGWTGPVLRETSQGLPLTHEILENLGVLKQDNLPSSESFEEDLHALQRKLFANGAGFMKQEVSFDNHSDSDHSPMFEPAVTQRTSHFTNPWISNHFPPTPPTGSPRPSLVKASSPLKAQIPMSKPQYSADPSWEADSAELPESMELNITYESPMDFTSQAMLNPGQLYLDPTQLSIQPSLTMKDDWYRQEDQTQRYFHRGIFT